MLSACCGVEVPLSTPPALLELCVSFLLFLALILAKPVRTERKLHIPGSEIESDKGFSCNSVWGWGRMNEGNSQALKGSCSFVLPLVHGKIVAFTLFCTWIQSRRIWEDHQAQVCPVLWLAAQKYCCTSNPSFSDVKTASIPLQSRFFNLLHLQLEGNLQQHSPTSQVSGGSVTLGWHPQAPAGDVVPVAENGNSRELGSWKNWELLVMEEPQDRKYRSWNISDDRTAAKLCLLGAGAQFGAGIASGDFKSSSGILNAFSSLGPLNHHSSLVGNFPVPFEEPEFPAWSALPRSWCLSELWGCAHSG